MRINLIHLISVRIITGSVWFAPDVVALEVRKNAYTCIFQPVSKANNYNVFTKIKYAMQRPRS